MGDVLVPFLYIILYTLDHTENEQIQVDTFSDDTSVLYTHRDPAQAAHNLQQALNVTTDWFQMWSSKLTKIYQINLLLCRIKIRVHQLQ